MLKKVLALALVSLFATASVAGAACTAEEAQEKANAFTAALTEAAQKDQQKYMDAVTAMQNDLPALQENPNDLDALCKFYDEWTEKLK